jgi:hypothetical protein
MYSKEQNSVYVGKAMGDTSRGGLSSLLVIARLKNTGQISSPQKHRR